MKSRFSDAWTACKNAFSGVSSWASGIASTIGDKFRNLGSTVGNAIGGAVKTAINGVIRTIENTINKAISLINGAIRVINYIPGVDLSYINSIYLPRLARGSKGHKCLSSTLRFCLVLKKIGQKRRTSYSILKRKFINNTLIIKFWGDCL